MSHDVTLRDAARLCRALGGRMSDRGLSDLRDLAPGPQPPPVGPLPRPAPRPAKPRTPLKPRNEARARARLAEAFGEQAALCRRRSCSVPGCRVRPCVPHHETSRGAGGDDAACVPLCWPHHDECHRGQVTFEGKHGIDLGEIAAALAAELAARPAHDCEHYARLVEREPGLVSFYRCERCGYRLPEEQEDATA